MNILQVWVATCQGGSRSGPWSIIRRGWGWGEALKKGEAEVGEEEKRRGMEGEGAMEEEEEEESREEGGGGRGGRAAGGQASCQRKPFRGRCFPCRCYYTSYCSAIGKPSSALLKN